MFSSRASMDQGRSPAHPSTWPFVLCVLGFVCTRGARFLSSGHPGFMQTASWIHGKI